MNSRAELRARGLPMNAESCLQYGSALGPLLTERGAVADVRHEVGGRTCRALAFHRDAEARGLMRVAGEEAVELRLAGIEVVTGPLDPHPPRLDGSTVVRIVDPSKPRPTSASYAPRWARYFRFALPNQFARLSPVGGDPAGIPALTALAVFRASCELQEALCACVDLAHAGKLHMPPPKLRRALRKFIEGVAW